MNVCFYISDHGFGHAARQIAVIRALRGAIEDASVYVRTEVPAEFIARSLPWANVSIARNDFGVVMKESFEVDLARTEKKLESWIKDWDGYIEREKRFCRSEGVGLIVSDIVPQAFRVSEELGIPGVAISNFTWHLIYSSLFGNTSEVAMIGEAYRAAELALVLPLGEEMKIFKRRKKIPLVARQRTRDRHSMRRSNGFLEDEFLVYAGLKLRREGFKVVASSYAGAEGDVLIPPNDVESQDYVGMCDAVVSKAGYSTVSEALVSRLPMFLVRRRGFLEDELIIKLLMSLGAAREITHGSLLNGSWRDELMALPDYSRKPLPDRLTTDGSRATADALVEFLGQSSSS